MLLGNVQIVSAQQKKTQRKTAKAGKVQGVYPSKLTPHWLKPEPSTTYTEVYIYATKKKGNCEQEGEENTICNGYIFIYDQDTAEEADTYYILNYVGAHPNGHLFDVICKSNSGKPSFTGQVIMHVTGNVNSGAYLTIQVLTENLKGSLIDNITMIGAPN